LSLLFLKGGFLAFAEKSGSVIKVSITGIIRDTGIQDYQLLERLIWLTIICILIPVFSAVSIFLFKKRNVQIWLVSVLIILNVILILFLTFYAYVIITKYNAIISPGIKMAVPVLQLIFSILAFRGIKKDDNLVKSYERLR
jgi:glucan phosphoethanolaminetransferase (alkaline phosphatase superfamily)